MLGFDGADAKLTEQWMNEGKLPNLARLREQGTFSPLRSTIPSQTPVSWSTFSTGLNPGRTSIFDFLKRDTKTYRPSFAAFDESSKPFLFGASNGPAVGALAAAAIFLVLLLLLKLFRVRLKIAAVVAAVFAVAARRRRLLGGQARSCPRRFRRSSTGAREIRSGRSSATPASTCA